VQVPSTGGRVSAVSQHHICCVFVQDERQLYVVPGIACLSVFPVAQRCHVTWSSRER